MHMSDHATPSDDQGVRSEAGEIEQHETDEHDTGEREIDDDALEAATGGQLDNSTEIVYASTFVPFDSSF
jgi:hypothetical protein